MHQCVNMTFDLCVVVCKLKKRHTLELCSVHVVSRVKKCEIQKNMNKKMRIINSMLVIPHLSVNI